MTIAFIALIVALVLFILAAFNVPSRPNLVAAGLACVVVSMLAGHTPF